MQLRMSPTIKFFEKGFKEKYNLDDYLLIDKPTLFCGFYRQSDRFAIQNHIGLGIIYLAGSDTIEIRRVKWLNKYVKGRKNFVIIVASDWIENDLKKYNIPCYKIPLLRTNINLWK